MEFLKSPLFLVFVFIAVFGVGLYLIQDKILFVQQPISPERLQFLRNTHPEAEEVRLKTSDGVEVHGWFVKAAHEGKSPLIIYFGGNGEEVSRQIETAGQIKGWSLLLINYRGYGQSGGKPGEEKLLRDALEIYDHFAYRDDVDEGKIVAMGRSLGTGVAVHLAENRRLTGVILVSPYDSIANVAREIFPFWPASLVNNPFEVVSLAPRQELPMLAITGEEDRVISAKRSQQLIDAWGGPVTRQVIRGEEHNTLQQSDVFMESINAFLDGLEKDG